MKRDQELAEAKQTIQGLQKARIESSRTIRELVKKCEIYEKQKRELSRGWAADKENLQVANITIRKMTRELDDLRGKLFNANQQLAEIGMRTWQDGPKK